MLRSWIDIDLSAFSDNFLALKKMAGADKAIMQIVKADAYGHGALEISKLALELGATSLGIANADEGAILRYQGITCPILILSPSLVSEIPLIIENQLIPAVSDVSFAIELSKKVNRPYKIHINIDSGMGRSGIQIENALEDIQKMDNLENLIIDGIFTHYSSAENDSDYTKKQTERFQDLLGNLDIKPQFLHYANSSAIVSIDPLPGNMVRIGALSYGFYTDNKQKSKISLKPVMNFYSRISQIKKAACGDYIGYNRTYRCPKNSKIAIIPVGYADGYDFLLSNCGQVAIDGYLYPVIGKVSMDMIAVDITGSETINLESKVKLLGDTKGITAEELTSLYKGNPYELLCQTGRRAKKFFYRNGKIISSSPRLRREFVSFDYDRSKLTRIIESAVNQRTQSSEIADFITEDLIKEVFRDQDNQIHYRHNFKHHITFLDGADEMNDSYFTVKTELRYRKVLSDSNFMVICAKSENELSRYLRSPIVEYRWLLDNKLPLGRNAFNIDKVTIDGIELDTDYHLKENCLEITCESQNVLHLIGKEVEFDISTTTYYPKSYHQLSVFITDITRAYEIEFTYPKSIDIENTVPLFSGRENFPEEKTKDDSIIIKSQQWVFPISGVVFIYKHKN